MDYIQVILIAASAALTVFLLILAVTPKSEKEIVESRVDKYFKGRAVNDVEEQVFQERNRKKAAAAQDSRFISKDMADFIQSSGIKLTPREFLLIWLALIFLPLIILSLLRVHIVTILAVAIIGFLLPPFLLQHNRKKNMEKFTKQLGESLVVMGNAVRGGFSFRQAMESVARDMEPPISSEFAKTLREINYGISQDEAFKHLKERMKNPDLDLLVCAVSVSTQVGGNLSEILEIIAGTIRDRIRIKQEIRVYTSAGRISALVIGLLPVMIILFIMLLSPKYFSGFFQSPIGVVLAVISVVMEIIGFFLIRKISDVKY